MKCRACGYEPQRDAYGSDTAFYTEKLDCLKEYCETLEKSKAVYRQNGDFRSFMSALAEAARASEVGKISADEFEDFTNKIKPLINEGTCITLYLHNGDGVALDMFRHFIAAKANRQSGTSANASGNIFEYFMEMLVNVRTAYGGIPYVWDDRYVDLIKVIIDSVNGLMMCIATRTKPKGRLRLYRSASYPALHDNYVAYLRELVNTVKAAKDKNLEKILDEVF